jgi:DNA-binding LytR/AlgR family response regulator
MQTLPSANNISSAKLIAMEPQRSNDIASTIDNSTDELQNFFKQFHFPSLEEVLTKLANQPGKKNFLVFKNNKYINVPTENIAFFYIKYESPMITCFDKQEYFVNYSLDQVQNLLPAKQFYRVNRQYLVNFHAVKEVEHYFARKLLVNPVIPTREKLVVAKEKVTDFLHWLDNR